jgi:hypothetical protein
LDLEGREGPFADIWLVQFLAGSGRHRHFIVSNFAQTPPSALSMLWYRKFMLSFHKFKTALLLT